MSDFPHYAHLAAASLTPIGWRINVCQWGFDESEHMTYELLEHVGELELRLRASSLSELFAEAGGALAEELLRGSSGGAPIGPEEIELRAADRAALLVDWLNELIFRADGAGHVLRHYDFARLTDTELRCRASGVRTELAVPVKAATFHGLSIEEHGGELSARVILDI